MIKGRLPINMGQISRIQRQAKEINSQARPVINEKDKIVVIPYMVVSGTTILTDTGEYTSNENLNNYGQRKVLWNGRDNIILMPVGWGRLIAYDSGGAVIFNPNTPADHVKKSFNEELPIGSYFNGLVQSHSQSMEISNSNLFEDVKQSQNIESIEMIFTDFYPDQNHLEYFYEIPEISPNTWYKMENASIEFVQGEANKTIVVFTSINDELSATGRARDQYFHRSAPGEGYPRYSIIYDEITKTKIPKLDKQFLEDTPITSVQIELFGSGIVNSIICIGRNATNRITNDIKPSHFLLSHSFQSPMPTILTKSSLPVSTYYPFLTGHTDTRFYYKEIEARWAAIYNEKSRPDAEGYFVIESSIKELRDTSTIVSKSTGQKYSPGAGTGGAGPIPSDPLLIDGSLGDWAVRSSIWHNVDFTLTGSSTGFTNRFWVDGSDFLETTGNTYENSNYQYIELFTTAASTWTTNSIHLMNLFALAYWDTLKLPMDMTTITAFTPGNIPVIGGLFNKVGIGKIWSWQSSKTWTPSKLFGGFIPTITAEFFATYFHNQSSASGRVLIPFGVLRNDTSDTSTPLVGTKSQNTMFRIGITDIVENKSQTKLNTVDMGQKGTKGWKYNPLEHTAINSANGFLIDAIVFKTISKANYRLSFFDGKNEPIWQGRYMTQSKWDNNDRSWNNIISLSPWNNNLSNKQSFAYPKAYNPHNPPPITGTFKYDFNQVDLPHFYIDNINQVNISTQDGGTTTAEYTQTKEITDYLDIVYPTSYTGDQVVLNNTTNNTIFFNKFSFNLDIYPNQTYPNYHYAAMTWEPATGLLNYNAFDDDNHQSSNLGGVIVYRGGKASNGKWHNDITRIIQKKSITTDNPSNPTPQTYSYNFKGINWTSFWLPGQWHHDDYGNVNFDLDIDISFTDEGSGYPPPSSRVNHLTVKYKFTWHEGNGDYKSPISLMKRHADAHGWTVNQSVVDYLNHCFLKVSISNFKFHKLGE